MSSFICSVCGFACSFTKFPSSFQIFVELRVQTTVTTIRYTMDKDFIEVIEVSSTDVQTDVDVQQISPNVEYQMNVLEYAGELVNLLRTLSGNGSVHGEFTREVLEELLVLFDGFDLAP